MRVQAFLLALFVVVTYNQSCLSDTGQAVDWFVVLKAPTIKKGFGFGYFDSTMKKDRDGKIQFKVMENKSIIMPGHAVYNTLKQVNDYSL